MDSTQHALSLVSTWGVYIGGLSILAGVVLAVIGAKIGVGWRFALTISAAGAAVVGTAFALAVLTDYLFWIALAGGAVGLALLVGALWGRRKYIEKFLDQDIDRDGKIG